MNSQCNVSKRIKNKISVWFNFHSAVRNLVIKGRINWFYVNSVVDFPRYCIKIHMYWKWTRHLRNKLIALHLSFHSIHFAALSTYNTERTIEKISLIKIMHRKNIFIFSLSFITKGFVELSLGVHLLLPFSV